GWVGERGLVTFQVRGRLAVGDHDDLLVADLLAPEALARERKARVHVGPDVPVGPREARELLVRELARVEREPDDVEAVALEVAEDVTQRLVGDLAERARRQLEPVATTLEVARLLELLRDLAELLEVPHGLLAQELGDLCGVDLLEVGGALRAAQLALELVHPLELLHELHRLTERHLFVATELVAAAQLVERQELLEVAGELGQRGFETLVLHEERAHHVLKLSALAGRHALEERLHLRDPATELSEQLVEALGAGEELAPLVLERLEVGRSEERR